MSKKTKLLFSALALLAGGSVIASSPSQAAVSPTGNDKTNVIVILVDDLALPDVSAYGYNLAPTPNIDKLAQSGTLFTNAYVAASVSAVSRAAILTGRSPQKFGFTYNLDGKADKDKGLSVKEETIASRLKGMGYNTAAIGKWHQGKEYQFYPTNRGFDEFYGFLNGENIYINKNTPGYITTRSKYDEHKKLPLDRRVGDNQIYSGSDKKIINNIDKYLTDDLTDQAINYITRQSTEEHPFFLYMAYNAPHWPMQVAKEYYDKFPEIKDPVRRTYVAMISNLDANIGRLIEQLNTTSQYKNTIVFFLSDNGCPKQLGFCDCSSPLGAGKFSFVDGGTHVPYIVKWPDAISEVKKSHSLVSSMDIIPTILNVVSPELSKPHGLEGIALTKILSRPEEYKDRALFFGQAPLYSVRKNDWKLWISEDRMQTKLYEIKTDPHEDIDISKNKPDITKHLVAQLSNWRESNVEPHWPRHTIYNELPVCGKTTEGVY